MNVSKAAAEDLEGIRELLGYYSRTGLLTPRTGGYLRKHLQEFSVCNVCGRLAGCCALHKVDEGLAEVRCFAVSEEFKGNGVGGRLLERCLQDAREQGFARVFTLTLEGGFFRKNGFTRMSKFRIPLKTFRGEPEVSPMKTLRWMKLFLKMITSDSAYEIGLN